MIVPKLMSAVNAQEDVCIDETIIPFRGRLIFRQYVPNKKHRYGVKIFKLCLSSGYTWSVKVYAGKEATTGISVPQKVVMELINPLLDAGRTLYCDNWYTSVSLANQLLRRNTHLVGTLRSNRKGNPKQVIDAKLKKGETIAAQSANKITVLKWQDKRAVLLLSTKHNDEIVDVCGKNGVVVRKPKIVEDYNTAKAFIDLSDQMSSYSTVLRRTIKWYRKVLFEVIFGTVIVNSMVIYNMLNQTSNKTLKITKFREILSLHLLQSKDPDPAVPLPTNTNLNNVGTHRLLETEGSKRSTRRKCSGCYKIAVEQHGRQYAQSKTRKVNTRCCVCNKYFCLPCFNASHKITK